jgi:hypothetical protein
MSFLSSVLKEIAEFKGWELIFQGLMYSFLIWALYNLKIIYEFHTSDEWAHITKYSIFDFKLAFVFVAVFLGYKTACHRIFFNIIKNRLDPAKFPTEEDKNARSKTSCNWVGNIIYYSFSTITCFLLFKDMDFFPKDLGGKAEPIKMYEGVPNSREYDYAVLFYMVQFGRHLHTLIDYCVYKWNTPKFWEMFLHHCTAVFLIFFSYLTNNLRVGILVLFVHDPSDIFLCSARLIESLKNHPSSLKYANYILFVASWVFFRLYAFPKCIVGSAIGAYQIYDVGRLTSPMLFMLVMLSALVVLHFYWFIIILRILVTMLRGKKNYNLYDTAAKKQDGITTDKENKD